MDENNLYNNQNQVYNQNMVQPPRAVVYDTMPVKNNMAIAGLIISLFALFFSWTIVIGFVLGLLGLVCSIVSISRKERSKGMAIAGIIISTFSILFGILMIILMYIIAVI